MMFQTLSLKKYHDKIRNLIELEKQRLKKTKTTKDYKQLQLENAKVGSAISSFRLSLSKDLQDIFNKKWSEVRSILNNEQYKIMN